MQQQCFKRLFPFLIGGPSTSYTTILKAIDIDANSNILVGGSTTDTSYQGFPAYTQCGFAQIIDPNGKIPWSNYYCPLSSKFKEVTQALFNPSGNLVVLTFDKTLAIVVLNANDGTLYNSYTIGNYATVNLYKQSLAISSNNTVFIAASSTATSSGWMMFSFQIQSQASSSSGLQLRSAFDRTSDKVKGLFLTSDENRLYVTGNMQGVSYVYPALVKIENFQVSLIVYSSYTMSFWSTYWATQVDVLTAADIDTAYNVLTVIDSTSYFFGIMIQRVVSSGSTISAYELFSFSPTLLNVIGIKAITSSTMYVMGDDDSTYQVNIYTINFSYSATKASIKALNIQGYSPSSYWYRGVIKFGVPNDILYFVGQTQTSFISSQYSISGYPGVLTSTDADSLCYKPTSITKSLAQITAIKQTIYLIGVRTTILAPDTQAISSSVIANVDSFGQLSKPTKNFCPYYSGMTAYPSSLTYKCYSSDGNQVLATVTQFKFTDTRCTDLSISYSMTSDYTSSPQIFTFDPSTFQITCSPSIASVPGAYLITITGTAQITTPGQTYGSPSPLTKAITYNVQVLRSACDESLLTVSFPPSLPNLVYYYKTLSVSYSIGLATPSSQLCTLTQYLVQTNGESITNAWPQIIFDSSNGIVTISNIPSQASQQDIDVKIVANSGTRNFTSGSFVIQLKINASSCDNGAFTMTTQTLSSSSYTYDLYQGRYQLSIINCPINLVDCSAMLTYQIQIISPSGFTNQEVFSIANTNSYNHIYVEATDISLLQNQVQNVFTVKVQALGPDTAQYSCVDQFQVIFQDSRCLNSIISVGSFQPSTSDYTIGEPSLIIQFSEFSNSIYCGDITYSKVLSGITSGDSMTAFSNIDKTFTIQSSDYNIQGFTFDIKVKGQIYNGVSKILSTTITVHNPCDSLQIQQLGQQTDSYTIGSSAKTIIIPSVGFASSNVLTQCQSGFSTTITLPNGISTFTSIISTSLTFGQNGELSVSTSDYTKAGNYTIEVKSTYKSQISEFNFILQIQSSSSCLSVTPVAVPDIEFDLSAKIYRYTASPWIVNPDVTPSVCQSIEYSLLIDGFSEGHLPSFLGFDSQSLVISIVTMDISDVGVYQATLVGTSGVIVSQVTFSITINDPCAQALIIKRTLADQIYLVGTTSLLTFPKWQSDITDCSDFTYTADIQGSDQLKNSIVFNPSQREFQISSSDFSLGGQQVEINVKGQAYFGQDSFRFKIQAFSYQQSGPVKNDSEVISLNNITISKDKLKENVTVLISEVNQYGLVNLKFSKPILTLNWTLFYEIEKSLNVTYKTIDNKLNRVNWTYSKWTENSIQLLLNFSDPKQVSLHPKYDTLIIKFKDTRFYISDSLDGMVSQNFQCQRGIPPQLDSSDLSKDIAQLGEKAGFALTSSFTVNLILAIVLGFGMKNLWMLMNTLQIIVFMPNMQLSLPNAFVILCSTLNDIANLNFIPKDQIKGYLSFVMSEVSVTSQITPNFQSMDIFKPIVQNNTQLFKVSKAQVYHKIQELSFWPWAQKIYTKLKTMIFFNAFLRSILKGYLNFVFAINLSLQAEGQSVSNQVITLAFGIFIYSLPFTTFQFLKSNSKKLGDNEFIAKFNSLYLNIKNDHEMNICIFLFRRLAFCMAVNFAGEYPTIQNGVLIMTSFALIHFQVMKLPHDSKVTQFFEIFNEATILALSYVMIPFALDYFDEDKMQVQIFIFTSLYRQLRDDLGLILIAIVIFNLAMNYANLFGSLIYTIILKIKAKLQAQKSKTQKLPITATPSITKEGMSLRPTDQSCQQSDLNSAKKFTLQQQKYKLKTQSSKLQQADTSVDFSDIRETALGEFEGSQKNLLRKGKREYQIAYINDRMGNNRRNLDNIKQDYLRQDQSFGMQNGINQKIEPMNKDSLIQQQRKGPTLQFNQDEQQLSEFQNYEEFHGQQFRQLGNEDLKYQSFSPQKMTQVLRNSTSIEPIALSDNLEYGGAFGGQNHSPDFFDDLNQQFNQQQHQSKRRNTENVQKQRRKKLKKRINQQQFFDESQQIEAYNIQKPLQNPILKNQQLQKDQDNHITQQIVTSFKNDSNKNYTNNNNFLDYQNSRKQSFNLQDEDESYDFDVSRKNLKNIRRFIS